MNEVYINSYNNLLFAPGEPNASLHSLKQTTAEGSLSQLEFTIFENNPYYDKIKLNDIIITNQTHQFVGVVVSISRSLFGGKSVLAISAETLFSRVLVTPQKATTTLDIAEYFNAFFPFIQRSYSVFDFSLALMFVSGTINPLGYEFTDALSILKMICENNQLTFSINWDEFSKKITFILNLKTEGNIADEIIFGENMLDYADEFSLGDIITGVWALGAEDGTYSTGATKYICITNNAADTVNNIIENSELVNLYGRNTKAIQFGDITDRALLRRLATEWLAQNAFAKLSLNVSGVNLDSLTGQNYYDWAVGDRIRVVCAPYGVDTTLTIQQMTVDLLHPEQSVIQLSGKRELSYTQQIQRKLGGLYYD